MLSEFAKTKKKSETQNRLKELDSWLSNELPKSLKKREHMILKELSNITEWKMTRGQWRPRNLQVPLKSLTLSDPFSW